MRKGAEIFNAFQILIFILIFRQSLVIYLALGKKISVSQHLKMDSPTEYNLCECVHAVQNFRCLFLQNVACFNSLFVVSRVISEMGIEAKMMVLFSVQIILESPFFILQPDKQQSKNNPILKSWCYLRKLLMSAEAPSYSKRESTLKPYQRNKSKPCSCRKDEVEEPSFFTTSMTLQDLSYAVE